jgi:UDP:flavonoid glycosyltransferase YjiC (YdhE family)
MRIVFATFGSLGDLHPYLTVARELQRRGHDPVIATSAGHRPRIEAAGLSFLPVRPDLNDFGDPATWMRRANHSTRGSEYVLRQMILPRLRESYDDLIGAAEGADLLISHMVTFAVPIASERLGVPWVGTLLQPLTLFSNLDPPVYPAAPWLRRLHGVSPRLYTALFRTLQRGMLPWMEPVWRLRRELGLPPTSRHPIFEGQFAPDLNLALFSRVLAEPQPDWPANVVVTGFPFSAGVDGTGTLPPALRQFLDAGSPPIVFTLGSSAVADPERFYEHSAKAAALLGRRAVLLVGEGGAPRDLPPGVVAFDYVSHAALFPRAEAVVIHGGIGTTGEALRAARPILFVPFSHDQPDNAARAGRLGVSRTVSRRDYTAARAARALEALLVGTHARRAAEVAETVRAERGAARAADAIERLFAGSRGAPGVVPRGGFGAGLRP